ncbi:N-acetyltransferase ESCO2 [Orchesella cincta]|uniref:N-acetyltransferase ESCO2 n=1 Tax=Orchesella cincta TaxID=48709 RepID=A0A1D2MJI7_ORCCI|nr:N-acetyltransferase ESCO2 [Orchesella cincta]
MSDADQNGKKLFPIFDKTFRPRKPDPLQEIQHTLQKCQMQQHHLAKRRKCLLGKKETPGLTQMILDAGQKEIGPVFCAECGLLYSPGDIEDEKEHRKAHSRLENLFCIRLWKGANIVQEFPTEACIVVQIDCSKESKRVLNAVKDFLAWLDSELGADYEPCGTQPSEKILLYLFKTRRKNAFRVLGCCVVETIDQEKISCRPIEFNNAQGNAETDEKRILLGITRLWTDTVFRNRHIASRLCDCIRLNCGIPGIIISKNQIGILEPSEDGKTFMMKYTNNSGVQYGYIA